MSRKKSREKAMEILFSMSLTKDTASEAIESFIENYEDDIKELDLDYISSILNGVEEKKSELDSLIEANLKNWKLGRVSKVNLAILRIAIYEMKNVEDVPERVALNEALELCKRYSDEKSVSFINAVLDKVLSNI